MNPARRAGLRPVADRLAVNPRFLAHHRARPDPTQRMTLGLTHNQLLRLALCTTPRPDSWAADMQQIADHLGAEPHALLPILQPNARH